MKSKHSEVEIVPLTIKVYVTSVGFIWYAVFLIAYVTQSNANDWSIM